MDVATTAELVEDFGVDEVVGEELAPSWNVAPTDPVRMVVRRHPHGTSAAEREAGPEGTCVQLRTVRWGLVPSWSTARRSGAPMINARSETVASKPAFKAAFLRRRCLLPALGYYEWQKTGAAKVPHFLEDPAGATLAMAGLYEIWRDPDLPDDHPERWLWTAAVITRAATDALGAIHDRTPVLVPAERREAWLDCTDGDRDAADALLRGMPEPHLAPRVVSTAVNSVRHNGPELLAPPEPGGPSGSDQGRMAL